MVAAILAVTDVVLAATFRFFLLGRVDDQIVQSADPFLRGRLRNASPGPRIGGSASGAGGPDTVPGAGARFVVELPLLTHTERIRTSVASGT